MLTCRSPSLRLLIVTVRLGMPPLVLASEAVTLARHDAVRPQAIRYLNRLSDLLFVLARVLARVDGHGEVIWKHERRR